MGNKSDSLKWAFLLYIYVLWNGSRVFLDLCFSSVCPTSGFKSIPLTTHTHTLYTYTLYTVIGSTHTFISHFFNSNSFLICSSVTSLTPPLPFLVAFFPRPLSLLNYCFLNWNCIPLSLSASLQLFTSEWVYFLIFPQSVSVSFHLRATTTLVWSSVISSVYRNKPLSHFCITLVSSSVMPILFSENLKNLMSGSYFIHPSIYLFIFNYVKLYSIILSHFNYSA